jgi:hypothetical protein
MTEWQRKTAVRVANVPVEEFEEQVENETPPTKQRPLVESAHLAIQGVSAILRTPLVRG